MSHDCTIHDPVTGQPVELSTPHQMAGGTYAVGGSTILWLSVTYNYGGIIRRVLPGGIPSMDGRRALDTIESLKAAVSQLGDDADPDYWKATEGNAKQALTQLLTMAEMRPDGVWRIT